MTRRGLSETESKVYIAVRAFHRLDPPRAPTLREVAEAIGWKHEATVAQYVKELEAAGYVHRRKGRKGIQLGPAPLGPTPQPEGAPN